MGRQLWAHHAVDLELVQHAAPFDAVLELRGTRSYDAELDEHGDRAGIMVTRDELAELVRYCVAHGLVKPAP